MNRFHESSMAWKQMPERYFKDDEKWIQEILQRLPATARKSASEKYSAVFEEELSKEPVEHKKENKARREANTRLRNYVERFNSVIKCEVSEPPVFRA